MFVQVIRGRATDPEGLRAQWDSWKTGLAAGSVGWLGGTAGVTKDGEFVAIERFESEEAARANSDRPEQGEWWAGVEKLLENVRFADTTDVVTWGGGGSDDAGFVQVMEGPVADRAAATQMVQDMEGSAPTSRTDVLGGQSVLHRDDRFTTVVYFVDEAAAREGERQEPSPEDAARFEAMEKAFGEISYIDLTDPWLQSP